MSDDLGENYKKAYDNALGFGKRPAMILVDFVQAYFEPDNMLYADVDDALASAIRVRDIARSANVPIFYTNVVYQAGGIDGGVFFKKAKPLVNFIKGSPMGAWPEGLDPLPDEPIFSKLYPSAFFCTSLSTTLTAMGIDSLIITGLATSGCIRATCIACCSYGFIPIIVADACGDRHEDPHRANLFDMNAKYGDVVSEAAVTAFLKSLR
ncbi:MAG: isochorismatase family protein [Sphingomonadales bacterium]